MTDSYEEEQIARKHFSKIEAMKENTEATNRRIEGHIMVILYIYMPTQSEICFLQVIQFYILKLLYLWKNCQICQKNHLKSLKLILKLKKKNKKILRTKKDTSIT